MGIKPVGIDDTTGGFVGRALTWLQANFAPKPTGTPNGSKFLRDDYTWQTLASGGFVFTDPAVNQFVRSPFVLTSLNKAGSTFPGTVPKTFIPIRGSYTIGSVVMRVSTAGAAGSTVPVNIYADDGNGRPAGSAAATVTCATSATGFIETALGTPLVVSGPGIWLSLGTFTDTAAAVQVFTSAGMPASNLNTSASNGLQATNPGENQNASTWLWFPDLMVKRTA